MIRTVVATTFLPAVAAMSWLALAGDGSSAATKPKPTCTPEGTSLTISARNNTFDKDCLAAPAGTPFTIAFNNQDYDIHNVSIYDKDHGHEALYKGEVIYGPKSITYSVPAQAEGTYEFRCDPHADSMLGTFIVGSGGPTTTSSATTTSSTTTTTSLLNLPEILPHQARAR
ncbi:MAG TPA: cupredoxin domain-containing protein [Acidimicrobiia bacterium]|nr:cupredoxin domain-containing protein [Acidimicrobiia bacterium]